MTTPYERERSRQSQILFLVASARQLVIPDGMLMPYERRIGLEQP
jgi:hypothetical protein